MALSHLKGIYAAINQLTKKYHMQISEPWSPIFYSNIIEKQEPKLGFDTKEEVHGGFRETSLMKYQYPYLVDPSYKELKSIYRNLTSPKIIGKTFKQLGLKDGYVGSPARADTDYGRWFYQLIVDTYVKAAIDIFEKKPTQMLPRHVKTKMKLLFWQ
jgi:creatinine amidohydrolase/Fe(II)-dependent formamide hydrolase-like protein